MRFSKATGAQAVAAPGGGERTRRAHASPRTQRAVQVVPRAAPPAESADETTVANTINTVRFLAIDAVQKASSGHPGLPMGAAAAGYLLFKEFMQHNPSNPFWFDRDRFVLSAGHGCMLQYALMHLTGYESVPVCAFYFACA